MYRELASVGKVFGVRGGPYAGKLQTLFVSKLPESVRHRLQRAIRGSALPAPLLTGRVSAGGAKLLLWLVLNAAALAAVIGVASFGFGTVTAPYARVSQLAAYLALAMTYVWTGAEVIKRVRRARLAEGLYLFPLDLVTIAGDVMCVRPLGGLRRAAIRHQPRTSVKNHETASLELTFEDGAIYTFSCGSENRAEQAYEALEQAQEQIENLTVHAALEEAVRVDPFFELRSGNSGTEPWQPRTKPKVYGRATSVALRAGVATMLGTGLFFARNIASDNALYMQACVLNTRASYNNYLRQSLSHRHEADAKVHLGMLEKLAQDTIHAASLDREFVALLDHDRLSNVPDAQLGPDGKAEIARLIDDAQRNYAQRAGSAKFAGAVLEKLKARRNHGNGREMFDIQFGLRPEPTDRTPARACMIHALDPIELAVVAAFSRTLQEVVSPLLIQVRSLPMRRGANAAQNSTVGINVVLRGSEVISSELVFHTWVTETERVTHAFDLTMPAPRMIPPLRPSSLFGALVQPTPNSNQDADCTHIAARAFDRLYDELYGLFFAGPIRVPVEVTQ